MKYGLFNYCENVVLRENGVLNTVKLDGCACVLRRDDLVTNLNRHRNKLTVLDLTGTDRGDLCNLGLFLSRCGENDAALRLFFCFCKFDYDSVR